MSEAYLKAIELHKDFGHVQALRGVSVAAYRRRGTCNRW